MIYTILIGALAGFLAGKIMKGGGFGAFKNILLGILGGFVGGWLFDKFNISLFDGIIGDLSQGLIGALVILFVFGLFKKK
jgi:uncharacterized membrane protein YeaQ/YmgE (transglycosylase-associated protein family)